MDPTQPVSVAEYTPEIQSQPISVAPLELPPPIDPDQAAAKVVKAKMGIPTLPLTHDAMLNTIMGGGEDMLRKQAAAIVDLQTQTRKQQVVNELAKNQQRPFSPIEAQTIGQFLTTKATDPSSVFEEFYAKTYMDNLRKAAQDNPDSVLNEAQILHPEDTEKKIRVGEDLKAKKEWAQTLASKISEVAAGHSTAKAIFDFLKFAVPGYNEFNLRGVHGDYMSPLGTNLDRTATTLYHEPFDVFKAKTTAIVDSLMSGKLGGNPGLALTFIQHLTDPNTTSTLVDNIFSAMDFGAVGAKPFAIASRIRMGRQVSQAIKDALKAPDITNPTDLSSAGWLSRSKELVDRISPQLGESANLWESRFQGRPGETLATSSYMDNLVKRIEAQASELDLTPRFSLVPPQRGVGAVRGAQTMSTKSFMEDLVKRIETSSHEATGNIKEAGIAGATREVNAALTTGTSPVDSVLGLQSAFNANIQAIKQDTRGFSHELINRISESMVTTRDNLVGAISNTVKVERLPLLLAVEKNVRALTEKIKNDASGLSNNIMDIKIRHDPVQNIHLVDYYIGKSGTELFGKESTANAFLKYNPLGGPRPNLRAAEARVEQNGAGFHIVMTKPLDETQPLVRDGLIAMKETRTPDSMLNAWGGYLGSFRTPEETLSAEQLFNRKVAAYGPSTLLKLAKDTAEDIKKLQGWKLPYSANKQKWNDWKRVVDESKKFKDPLTGESGQMYKSVGELVDGYSQILHRLPDEQEVAAYFAYKNQAAIRHELLNLQIRTEKLRKGAETHTIYTLDSERWNKKGDNPFFKTIELDGTIQKNFPTDGETVLIVGNKSGQEQVKGSYDIKGGQRTRLINEIESGKSVLIKLTNPEERPFKYWNVQTKDGEARPAYVIARKVESKPLKWEQVSRKTLPDYDYDHYVAQPIIRKDGASGFTHYEGDRHIAGFNVQAMSRDFASRLDQIREHIKAGNLDAARAVKGLPQDFEEIHSWFKADVTTEGLPIPSRLSLEDQIKSIPYNKTVHDLDKVLDAKYPKLQDHTKENYNRMMENERDPNRLTAYENPGSKANPLYKSVPVQFVDPIQSMQRALNRVINDAYLADYKMFSVEHWIQEARPLLAIDDASLASAPTYFFHNPKWKGDADLKTKNNLMTAQLQIKQFLGIQDQTTTFLHYSAQQLQDAMYTGNSRMALVPDWAIPTLRDPFVYARSMAYHMIMGVFAIPQLWTQLQTFTNIWGIAGIKHAGAGTGANLLHTWSRFSKDEGILNHLDGIASKLGFRPGEWKEAHDLGMNTGFFNVSGEHALRDNPFKNSMVGSAGQTFLDWGTVAFREGERATRTGAWYTAYHEYRELNPTGKITNADARKILDRADLLTMNMSRASSSRLNQGVMSIPAQFLTYQLRTAELILGKRLTDLEKARTFGFNALLYGIPTAFGLTGLPIGDIMRRTAIENGYQVGDNYWNSLATEGGLSTLIAAVSGMHYNVGEKWGSKGLEQFDPLRSDEPWYKLILGASGSKLMNTVAGMDGYWNALMSAVRDDDKAYKMTASDMIKPFLEFASINGAWKFGMALNTGQWMSKKEAYVTDIDKGNAIFAYLSGLSPQEQSDMYATNLIRKHEKDLQTEALSKFTTEFRRYLRISEENPTQAQEHYKNAFAILRIAGYPEERIPAAISIAAQGYESLTKRTNWDFLTKDVPTYRKPAAERTLMKQ